MPDFDKKLLTLKEGSEKDFDHVVLKSLPHYAEGIIDYDRQNFEACLNQLLSLLKEIYKLNPSYFKAFEDYRKNLESSLKTASLSDQDFTLKAVKKGLELAYSHIQQHPTKIDSSTLTAYEVNACLSAAGSNILRICEHFYSHTLPENLIKAKKDALQDLAVMFIKQHHLLYIAGYGEAVGSEVHFVHGLYNHVAAEYGLKPILDSVIPSISGDKQAQFVDFVREHLNYRTIVQSFINLHPAPSGEVSFENIEEFLKDLGCISTARPQLYEQEEDKPTFKLRDLASARYQYLLYQLILNEGLLSEIEKITLKGGIGMPPLTCILFSDQICVEDPVSVDSPLLLNIRPLGPEHKNYIINQYDVLVPAVRDDLSYFPDIVLDFFIERLERQFDFKLVQSLLQRIRIGDDWHRKIAQVLSTETSARLESEEHAFCQLLCTTIKNNDVKLAALLFEKRTQLNSPITIAGETPIFIAAQHHSLEVLNLLLNRGLEVDGKRTLDNVTPLFIAVERGHVDVVAKLLEAKANKEATLSDGATPLFMAALKGHVDVVAKLLEAKANKEATLSDGATPLCIAAGMGHADVVAKLLEVGANTEAVLSTGATPLIIAAQQGHVDVVEKLLEAGASKEAALPDGRTPLFIAAQKGHIDVVAKLLEAEANKEAALSEGRTPLFIAAERGHIDVVAKLLEAGANKEAALSDGRTSLFMAAQNNHVAVVAKLLEAGANKEMALSNGATPLYIAAQNGYKEIVQMLIESFKNRQMDSLHHFFPNPLDKSFAAPINGNILILKNAIKNEEKLKAFVELLQNKELGDKETIPYLSSLHVAIVYGHTGVVAVLKSMMPAEKYNQGCPISIEELESIFSKTTLQVASCDNAKNVGWALAQHALHHKGY